VFKLFCWRDFRFGSKADLTAPNSDFRFTLDKGHPTANMNVPGHRGSGPMPGMSPRSATYWIPQPRRWAALINGKTRRGHNESAQPPLTDVQTDSGDFAFGSN
jgi:hypothetical protein